MLVLTDVEVETGNSLYRFHTFHKWKHTHLRQGNISDVSMPSIMVCQRDRK